MATPDVATSSHPGTTASNNIHNNDEVPITLEEIDLEFQQLQCVGHGGFGSVFLAQKKSGRQVALKFMRFDLDSDVEEEEALFHRELDAVLQLDCTTEASTNSNRDLSIVFFEDWFTGPGIAAIVMQYADGGTLADEIVAKASLANSNHQDENNPAQPYSERRIAWYALQLSEALAYAHQRGVFHHDVKSANVLIDRSGGGKLLLADFGSAIAPGEEAVKFTVIYAAPELQRAYSQDDFSGLEPDKIDAFGLGCILFELLCCKKLVDLTEHQTLAEFIMEKQSVDAALDLPCVCLEWATSALHHSSTEPPRARYSNSLRGLVKTLLEPNPANRWTPTELQKPLRQDPLSPLLAQFLSAAQAPKLGAPVSVDNIQLGMFVQRGLDWRDGDADGGVGSIGVVTKLDADAGYTEVSFPSRDASTMPPKPMCCRIGAGNKFELKIGYVPPDNSFASGIIHNVDIVNYSLGQLVSGNCMVVGIDHAQRHVLVAPMEKKQEDTLPAPSAPPPAGPVELRKPKPPPELWSQDLGVLIEVNDGDEKGRILEPFYAVQGGLDIQGYEILSIQRVQCVSMWTSYAAAVEHVASQNWGIANEVRLFHGSGRYSAEALLGTPDDFYRTCSTAIMGSTDLSFSKDSSFGDKCSYRTFDGSVRQMILSRVALGRVDDQIKSGRPVRPPHFSPVPYHSVLKLGPFPDEVYTITNPFQAYPEYIITYKVLPRTSRRVVRARRPIHNDRNRAPLGRRVPRRPQQQQGSPLFSTTSSGQAERASTPVAVPSCAAAGFATPTTTRSTDDGKTPGSAAKMCVICFEQPVNQILIPCGHPCLCAVCGTTQGLAKLKHKCPECRATIREAVRFYGKVVED